MRDLFGLLLFVSFLPTWGLASQAETLGSLLDSRLLHHVLHRVKAHPHLVELPTLPVHVLSQTSLPGSNALLDDLQPKSRFAPHCVIRNFVLQGLLGMSLQVSVSLLRHLLHTVAEVQSMVVLCSGYVIQALTTSLDLAD